MRINEDLEISVLFDNSVADARKLMNDKGSIAYSKLQTTNRATIDLNKIPVVNEVNFQSYRLCEHENGSIVVYENGVAISPAKPVLRALASEINIPIVNGNGNHHNTRTLGNLVISALITNTGNSL